ncbi:MAG TPA: translation initiation factor IF-2 [Candidatus Thermoplasmatota archaeon]|nr:translation initiation factor IF-2 [Candidatus Thermoplasmatota archaeon]
MAPPGDDRTAEEKLADELAAELEAEFGDLVDGGDGEPAAAGQGGATAAGGQAAVTEPEPAKPKEPEAKPVEASPEAIAKVKEQAKAATEGNVEQALGALEARSPTAYTRHPIVSVMGHVDHGKTSILDRIRGTKVFDREAGAITQHIGASEVPLETIYQRCGVLLKGKKFTVPGLLFIDTPGHHAFTSLRRRGGQLADIAVLVVDMTEGLMPQTLEAIQILRQTKTPFVVAANKVDRCQGWKTEDKPFILNVRNQSPTAQSSFDDKFYRLVAALYEQGLPAERYDRIADFTKNIAIVPTCAQSGEGIQDLLAMLVGLAQKFLETRLETDEELPGEGTVLEVKQDKGLGHVVDVILYAGRIRKDDTVLIGTKNEPLETRIKGLLKPAPLDEMRDSRKAYSPVDEIVAASGLKLLIPDAEGVVAGAPIRVLTPETREAAYEIVEAASKPHVDLSDTGVFVKADTIGGLEALANLLKERKVPIRHAQVGDISRRDVIEASSMTDPYMRVVLGFNVKTLPEVDVEAQERDLPVFTNKVIYGLLDSFDGWREETRRKLEAANREQHVHPCKVRFLPDHSFRMRDPAVFGVRVLAGRLLSGRMLMREDGKAIGRIKSIQKDKRSVEEAKLGEEVAISVQGPTIGRQIHEGDILHMDIPESDAKWLLAKGDISAEEKDVLMELIRVKRKEDRYWGL